MLLLMLLLLGVSAMHTLGHPQESGHGTGIAASSAAYADPASTHSGSDLPPMDPTSMCLAVGGTTIVLLDLAVAAFFPWPGSFVRPPSWIQRLAILSARLPDPPSLAKLQVLRV